MKLQLLLCPLMMCMLLNAAVNGQSVDRQDDAGTMENKVIGIPSRVLNRIQGKTYDMSTGLTRQTERYLQKMARREQQLKRKLSRVDSNVAKNLFNGSAEKYAALVEKMRGNTGTGKMPVSSEYQPYADSLQSMLSFLKQGAPYVKLPAVNSAERQLQAFQAKMQDAEQVKEYIRQRKQQIGDYISQHTSIAGNLGKQYQGLLQDQYYYTQQVEEYRDALNHPDELEQKALSLLNKVPAFQAFMQQHSQLASLFNFPANYGSSASLAGLQTRDQINSLINGQVAAGGAGGQAALQANLGSAQTQLNTYKDKLNQQTSGGGDVDMPDFKPNSQHTKAFWRRLEYGANFQTTRNNYYFPTTTDLGLSIGYKLGSFNTAGIGASFKLGWGNGINHIAFSGQGVGLRSFIDLKIKGSFFASGGFEYNYATPFRSTQQLREFDKWSRSGLLGISKIISVKSQLFKKSKLQLLWDFLSYQQNPKTQRILFRVGYNF